MSNSSVMRRLPQPLAAKVPAVGIVFWIMKVLTTGMGEAASDYLGEVSLVVAGAVGVLGLGIALWMQLRVRRYVASLYWLTVSMVAVFGTMAADGIHVGLGIPYAGSTVLYAVAVAVVFLLWYRSQGTLSIHGIRTRRREIYYWVTVLLTFALGTAAGDLTAASLGWGYLNSAVIFAVIMLVPVLGWWKFSLHPVVAFWFAYVVTRPLGASLADWLGKPGSRSGLGWGDGPVTGGAVLLLVGLVWWMAMSRSDVQPEQSPARDTAARTVRPTSTA